MKRLKFSLISSIALVVSLSGTSVFAQNLLTNPGFEASGGSYDGWFTFGSGPNISTAANDNIFLSGGASAKTFGEFTGCDPGTGTFTAGGFLQAFTPTPGMQYILRGYSFVADIDSIPGPNTCDHNRMVAQITFFDAATEGSVLQREEIVVADFSTSREQWNDFSVLSAPAPVGALRVEAIFLFLQPACDLGSVFIDDTYFGEVAPVIESNLLINPSFDDSLGGWTRFDNVFHESRVFAERTATGSAKLFSSFIEDVPSVLSQSLPATPGSDWRFSIHTLNTCEEDPIAGTNDNFGVARLVFRDVSDVEIGGEEALIVDNTSPLGTWVRHEVFAINAPPATAKVDCVILFNSPTLMGGAYWVDDAQLQEITPTAVTPTPVAFELQQNVPNPFRGPSTRIDFKLERGGAVDVSIFDVAGRRVATLIQDELGAGPHQVTWDGTTANGTRAPAGIYRYLLTTPEGRTSRSLVLID